MAALYRGSASGLVPPGGVSLQVLLLRVNLGPVSVGVSWRRLTSTCALLYCKGSKSIYIYSIIWKFILGLK